MPEPTPTGASPRTLRRRRRIGLAMIAMGAAVLLSGAWLAATGVLARSQLNQVRAEVHTLSANISAGQWPAARSTAADIATHAHRARLLTSGPIWALGAAMPSGGEPLQTIRGVTEGVDSVAQDALPQLVTAGERLNPRTLRRTDGSIELSRIAAVGPAVESASASVARVTSNISRLPSHTWLAPIDAAYGDALGQITSLDNALRSARQAVRILPTMLGQDGPKRYFLAFQNESEARGTGGLPGAFAIVEANHGKLRLTRFESDTTLNGVAANLDFGPDYHHLYDAAAPTKLYANGNISPHFPYAAEIWASMWQKYSGQKVDGVIAVDPTALGYLLDVTGPAALPDKSQISGANAVELTQSTAYAKFGENTDAATAQRRAYLLEIASAASQRILATRGDPTGLLRAVGKGAAERRVLVWSADPKVQADLAQTSVSGVIPVTAAPYAGLSIVNAGGNKLDYYLDRSLTWQRTGCGSAQRTTVTVKLTNDAPASGLSAYVTGRNDQRSYPVKTGDSRLTVSYFATQGTHLDTVTVAGRQGIGRLGAERGHPVYAIDVEVPRGASTTIVLHLREPATSALPIVLRQPLVRPLNVTLDAAACG